MHGDRVLEVTFGVNVIAKGPLKLVNVLINFFRLCLGHDRREREAHTKVPEQQPDSPICLVKI